MITQKANPKYIEPKALGKVIRKNKHSFSKYIWKKKKEKDSLGPSFNDFHLYKEENCQNSEKPDLKEWKSFFIYLTYKKPKMKNTFQWQTPM